MKTRLTTTIVPLTTVAFALACNAYATPAGVMNRPGRKNKTIRHASVPGNAHSAGIYNVRRFFPVVRTPMSSDSDWTTLGSSDGAAVVQMPPPPSKAKKFVGVTISSFLFAFILASSASRRFVADHLVSLLASYKTTMVRYPLQTKVVTGVVLAVLGDALAQTRDPSQTEYDARRAASFAAFDSCYRCFQHNAFPFIVSICQGNVLSALVTTLPGLAVGANLKLGLAALERTLLYQLVVIPLLYYPIFFTFTGYLQGLKPDEILQRAKTSFLPCWKKNLMFWIPTQMVMFGLIAEHWQIPFACVMGMLWSTILSVTAGNAKAGSKKTA